MSKLFEAFLKTVTKQKPGSITILLFVLVWLVLSYGCDSSSPTPVSTTPISPPSATSEQSIASATPTAVVQSSIAPTTSPTLGETVQTSKEPTETPLPTATSTPSPATNIPTAAESLEVQNTEPAATETPVVTETPAATPQQVDCIDQVTFLADVTIPDGTFFDPGEPFTKVWQVRNTGTCEWDTGYALVFSEGDIMNGALTNPVPLASPGDTNEVSLELVAPARTGQQDGFWQFQNAAGERFGSSSDLLWVQIIVKSFQSNPSPTPTIDESAPTAEGTEGVLAPETGECAIQRNMDYESEILVLINQARATNGLDPVDQQNQLSAAALVHSTDMACNGFVDHNGSDGSTWYDRVGAQGYANNASARENIYVGDPAFGGTPQGAFDWWMNSQVHRENILNPLSTQVGMGYVYLPESQYGGYFTLILARPWESDGGG
jgi:uncharacterized protein YkwD